MLVAFDFDGTINLNGEANRNIVSLMVRHLVAGNDVCVVTTRNPAHEEESWYAVHAPDRVTVRSLLEQENINVPVYYTCHAPKVDTMAVIGAYRLYDDDPLEIETVRRVNKQGISVMHDGKAWVRAPGMLGPCDVCSQDLYLTGIYQVGDDRLCACCLNRV